MLRELIEKRDADLFIFGGEGEFDEMAYDIVSYAQGSNIRT